MKKFTATSLLFIFLFNQMALAADMCHELFSSAKSSEQTAIQYPVIVYKKPEIKIPIKTESDRVRMTTVSEEGIKSRLVVEEKPLSSDPNEAVLEIMRLLLNNNDFVLNEKNVLEKSEMTIGIPLKDGFTFLVTFDSRSSSTSRFVINDKIVLATPTSDHKVTAELKDPSTLRLAKTEFSLPDFFQKDTVVNLKVPLSIDSAVLSKLKDFVKYFEHMDKDELRKTLAIESPFRRNTLLKLGRIKSMFKKEALKQPFKIVLGGTFMGLISFGLNHGLTNNNQADVFQKLNEKPAAVVEIATTKAPFTPNETLAQAQFKTIRDEAKQKAMNQSASAQSNQAKDLLTAGGESFTVNASTFIFEQRDPMNGSMHTYIVFAEEKVIQKKPALQYLAMEINAAKYAPLITAIKSHQQIK